LKRRTEGGLETLEDKRCVAADEKAAVAARLQTFRTVRNRGVQAVPDLSNGGETFVGNRLRGDARVIKQRPGQCGKRQREFRGGVESAKRRRARKETAPRKRSRKVVHGNLR